MYIHETNVSNGTSTLQGEHLCKIILKFMHKLIYVTLGGGGGGGGGGGSS